MKEAVGQGGAVLFTKDIPWIFPLGNPGRSRVPEIGRELHS